MGCYFKNWTFPLHFMDAMFVAGLLGGEVGV